jgi:hypothetical protein
MDTKMLDHMRDNVAKYHADHERRAPDLAFSAHAAVLATDVEILLGIIERQENGSKSHE